MSLTSNTFHVTHLSATVVTGSAIKLSSGIPSVTEGTAVMEKTLATKTDTALQNPWIYEHFPELVSSGDLIIVNGHIYLFGISFVDILTGGLAILSFAILLIRNGIAAVLKVREFMDERKKKKVT